MKRFFAQYDAETKIMWLDRLNSALFPVILALFCISRNTLGLIRFFEDRLGFTEFWADAASGVLLAIILVVENAIINHAKKRITQENPTEPPKES